ncbi:DUF6282 family protein [Sporomusa aerivorans]|uniref:DUF6282 family protein n=1 Tax=Sporomusa aerivorans TaxID=204936 RepID=UPI00352B840D
MKDVSYLLTGAVDLHVHAGPSVMPREVDAAEMLLKAMESGYQAFVVKDHYFPTMMSASIVEKHIGKSTVKVYGGIALNGAVGGLNLRAVDVACAMGAKFVWMPTISTNNHIVSHSHGLKFPSSKGMQLEETPLVYVNEQGELDSRVVDILNYMAHTDMILGTGHGCLAEIDALVEAACVSGVKKILVNHPLYMIGAGMPEIKKWAGLGAYIELNATVFVPESKFGVTPIEKAVEVIQTIGADKIVLDSDYGQKNNGCPVEGMKQFISLLVNDFGISETDISTMIKGNPAKLLGLS